MIYKISDRPYIAFDEHVDLKALNDLKVEICYGFSQAWMGLGKGNQALPAASGHPANWPNNIKNPVLPQASGKELTGIVHHVLQDATHPAHSRVKELVARGHQSYAYMLLKLIEDTQSIGYNIYIRQMLSADYSKKHLASETKPAPCAEHFECFMQWVDQQKIFDEVGRAVVFFNDQHQYCLTHRDHSELNPVDSPDEFIWVNLFPIRKRFFLIDDETGHKHYINHQVAWFDTANWHGSDNGEFAAFTIRVDGVFSEAWKSKIGLRC
jgi:hypothetical protein